MNKGQRAMAVAMIHPEGEKGGRGKRSTNQGEFSKYEQNKISEARTVLKYAPALADGVLRGQSLDWSRLSVHLSSVSFWHKADAF